MHDAHPLDRPVWTTLNTRWSSIAVGDRARAMRLPPQYWPLAAASDGSDASLQALAALVQPGETVSLIEHVPLIPPGLSVEAIPMQQMVATELIGPDPTFAWRPLGAQDAADMLALADETRPGPFSIDTWRIGAFVGVQDEGRLVAMAGERMGAPGFGEVSGVCTTPSHRGRGLAAGLMRLVGRRILARGEAVFLGAHTHNTGAVAMYRRLGFQTRAELTHVLLRREA